jgi:hypothetical protein
LSNPAARFNQKGCLPVWGWRALKPLEVGCIIRTGTALSYHFTRPLLLGMPSISYRFIRPSHGGISRMGLRKEHNQNLGHLVQGPLLQLCSHPHPYKSGAQYGTLPKCSSHPSLVIYFFLFQITPIKLKARLLRATHLDQ